MELNTTDGGATATASGATVENEQPTSSGADEGNSNFQRLLKEKKKLAEELKLEREKTKSLAEKEMLEKENYKELLKAREAELAEKNARLAELDRKEKSKTMKHALLTELEKLGLDSTYREQALRLANLEKLQLDEETGVVVGAVELAKSFYQTNSGLGFFKKTTPGANHNAPSVNIPSTPEEAFAFEIKSAKTQAQIDAVLKKYNK